MSDTKHEFVMHPETLIESIRELRDTGDTYNEYLAAEMLDALERADLPNEWKEEYSDL